jgi:asparagine synthase (glutamine-hydrolysing)
MCGIAGLVLSRSDGFDADLVPTLLHRLEHRGPDDFGFLRFTSDGVHSGREWPGQESLNGTTLLSRRLSILDLSANGWQPMGTQDGRYRIVYNGEIYNYLELRGELEALGHRFRSQTDTEVLLAAYAQWGPKALIRLVGMFAFAILDTRERKLFLARDFFGIKPLYYTFARNGFAFASEIKALLELPGVSREVNPERLYLYLRYGITDCGSETLLADIQQLPPAHYLEVSLDGPRQASPVRYWRVELGQRLELSFEEAAERLRELFLESIRLHLRSDVAVGAALSGGIDSSSIVMSMRYLQGQDLELHTFSYVADDATVSEESWVDLVGKASGALVHKVKPSAEDLVADLDRLILVQDEPFGSTSIYAQHRVFRLAHEARIKVMLDGQGADELFGGYRPYVSARLASLVRQGRWSEASHFFTQARSLPGTSGLQMCMEAANSLLPLGLQVPLRRLVGKSTSPPWLNATWFTERGVEMKPVNHSYGNNLLMDQLYSALTETSVPHLLRYEDRNSMSFSIESRVPFLTPALADFVFSLPEEYLVAPDGTSKAVFRRAMRGIVPDEVLDRRDKIGFATPERGWMTTLRPWVEQKLRTGDSDHIPALKSKAVEEEWDAIVKGHKAFDFKVWRWINLIEWSRHLGAHYN